MLSSKALSAPVDPARNAWFLGVVKLQLLVRDPEMSFGWLGYGVSWLCVCMSVRMGNGSDRGEIKVENDKGIYEVKVRRLSKTNRPV